MEKHTVYSLPLSRHALRRVVFSKTLGRALSISLLTLCLGFTACKGAGTGGDSGGGAGAPGTGGGPAGGGAGGGLGGGGGGGGGVSGSNPNTVFPNPNPPAPDPNAITNQDATLSIDAPSTAATVRNSVSFQGTINASQVAQLSLTTNNVTSFQIVSQAGGIILSTINLTSPTNQTLISFDDPLFQTSAVRPANDVNVLPYPANSLNPAVVNGKYKHLLFVNGAAGQQYFGVAIGKNDPSPAVGLLRVNIFLVGTTAQRAEVRDAVIRGTQIWRDIYSQVGIGLDVATFDVTSGTGVLPNPFFGSLFYQTTITNTPNVKAPAVNMFIASLISENTGTSPGDALDNVLGVASAIPGPANSTTKSVVALSVTEHQGDDGIFNPADISVFGETMAHEAGHYLGLFHVVEDPEGDEIYRPGDPLTDTPVCTTTVACIAAGNAENLMFPRVVFGIPQQRDLTGQQGQVMNLQTIVD